MNDNKTEYINTILALALIKYLYNKGKISESVYVNDFMSCHQTAHTNCHQIA